MSDEINSDSDDTENSNLPESPVEPSEGSPVEPPFGITSTGTTPSSSEPPPSPLQPEPPQSPPPPIPQQVPVDNVYPPQNPPQTPPQGAPQAGTYYSNQQGYRVSGPKNDGFAVTSLVLGLCSIVTLCCGIFGLPLPVLATIFGGLSLSKIKKSNGNLTGRGMALAGLILGIATFSLIVVFYIIYLAIGFSTDFTYYE